MTRNSMCSACSFARIAAVGAIVIALLVGFSGRALADKREVMVFLGTTPDFANVFAAKEKGFFAKEGLDVGIRRFPSGAAASDSFRAGKAHFLFCGDIPAIRTWKTMGSRYLAPTSRDFNTPTLTVKSEIKTVEDVKGKVLATRIGSSFELMADQFNKKYGFSPGDYELRNMEPADMVIALEKGVIDGFFWGLTHSARAKEVSGGRVHILLSGEEVDFPDSICLNTTAKVLKEDPDLVERFVRGMVRAGDWCMKNKEETSVILFKTLQIDPHSAASTRHMDFCLHLEQKLYRFQYGLSKYMHRKGWIDKPVDWDQFFYLDFLREHGAWRIEKRADTY